MTAEGTTPNLAEAERWAIAMGGLPIAADRQTLRAAIVVLLAEYDRRGSAEENLRRVAADLGEAQEKLTELGGQLIVARSLHVDAGPSQGYTDRGYGVLDHACGTCGAHGEYGVPWPCPTAKAMGVSE